MKPGLLLVDLQRDFLDRSGLVPRAAGIVREAQKLLHACREMRVPVIHMHTQVGRDGRNRMPHRKRGNDWVCVEGSAGIEPPEVLRPRDSEPTLIKQHWSAFSNERLAAELHKQQIDTLIVAGLFSEGCVRATAVDAYQRGWEVWIAEDAVGSVDDGQAEMARIYLEGRAATFLDTLQLLSRIGLPVASATDCDSSQRIVPVASIAGNWVHADSHQFIERRNPANWSETLAWTPIGTEADVARAGAAAAIAQTEWKRTSLSARAKILEGWAAALESRIDSLVKLLAREIGKPLADGREEVGRAIAHVRAAVKLCSESRGHAIDSQHGIGVRFQPQGVVGLITPWNNPLAIPLGKIAPALALGNGVVWKPAIEAPRTAMAVMETLHEAGVAAGLVNLVFGGSSTARLVIDCRQVAAISLTGSIASGRSAGARCAHVGKPLQAELGGNNAAIVLNDCDVQVDAAALARAAFSFAGQRCTALRRIIVERAILEPFQRAFVAETQLLRIGEPCDPATEVGPVISQRHRQRVLDALAEARAGDAEVLCGGAQPAGLEHGCWLMPAIVGEIEPAARLAQEETFGPVAVILPADDLDEAIEIANGVEQGLLAALYSHDENSRRRFAENIQAGILKFSPEPLCVHPEAPFGGWKASGLGPPEHGQGDRQFYTRPQATYGWSSATELER